MISDADMSPAADIKYVYRWIKSLGLGFATVKIGCRMDYAPIQFAGGDD